MPKPASLIFGVALMALLFSIGFSGSDVRFSPEPVRVPDPESSPSAGGADFLRIEPVRPLGTEVHPDGACRPVDRSGPSCGVDQPAGARVGEMAGADRWRPLVARHFASADVDRALDIIRCESRGDPGAANPASTARGLFQHLESAWPERAAKAARPNADIYDPEDNIAVAAWLVYHGGGWSHWKASGHCW